jgi:hypothetical protein
MKTSEKASAFLLLGRTWRNRKNGKRIAELMLLNFHERMPAQKKKELRQQLQIGERETIYAQ